MKIRILPPMLELVTLEQAKMLKAIGFNLKCHYYFKQNKKYWSDHFIALGYPSDYNGKTEHYVSKPSLAIAIKWLRDKELLHVNVMSNYNAEGPIYFADIKKYTEDTFEVIRLEYERILKDYQPMTIFDTWEQAESAALTKALEIAVARKNETV